MSASALSPPLAPLDLALLHAVPLPTWAALFKAHGVKPAPKSIDHVRAAARASLELAPALRTLRALSGDHARSALLQAGRVLGVETAEWPATASTAALTATLLARATIDGRDVLAAVEREESRRTGSCSARASGSTSTTARWT